MSDWYTHSGFPATGSSGSSASMRAELDAIAAAFAKLPAITGNANKLLRVNSVATAVIDSNFNLTEPATGCTLTIADTKTLTANNTLTLSGTDGKTLGINSNLTLGGVDGKTLTVNKSLTLDGADGKTLSANNTLTLSGTDGSALNVGAGGNAMTDAVVHALVEKTVLVAADEVAVLDSAATPAYSMKKATLQDVWNSVWTALGSLINGGTAKTTPVAADALPLMDSAAGSATKKLLFSDLLTTLYSYVVKITGATGSAVIPAGTTAQRDATPAAGYSRFNTSLAQLEYWNGTTWAASLDTAVGDSRYGSSMFSVSASVATNALTVGLNPCKLDFRNASLTSGTPSNLSVAAALSLTVPSGATLGTVNNQQARIAVLAINNAGTVELAVVNEAGGITLDETGLISTTAISAAATSASVIYSQTARTNVPYRVVGFIDATEATAGTWATAPSTIQGLSGMASKSLLLAGGQWVDQTASRAFSTTYYNTLPTPRDVQVYGNNLVTSGGLAMNVTLTSPTGVATTYSNGAPGAGLASGNAPIGLDFEVPPGYSYSVAPTSLSLGKWNERQR